MIETEEDIVYLADGSTMPYDEYLTMMEEQEAYSYDTFLYTPFEAYTVAEGLLLCIFLVLIGKGVLDMLRRYWPW